MTINMVMVKESIRNPNEMRKSPKAIQSNKSILKEASAGKELNKYKEQAKDPATARVAIHPLSGLETLFPNNPLSKKPKNGNRITSNVGKIYAVYAIVTLFIFLPF
jgi:hypothetical protein